MGVCKTFAFDVPLWLCHLQSAKRFFAVSVQGIDVAGIIDVDFFNAKGGYYLAYTALATHQKLTLLDFSQKQDWVVTFMNQKRSLSCC